MSLAYLYVVPVVCTRADRAGEAAHRRGDSDPLRSCVMASEWSWASADGAGGGVAGTRSRLFHDRRRDMTAVTASDGQSPCGSSALRPAIGVTIGQIVTAPFSAGVVAVIHRPPYSKVEAFDLVLQIGLEAGHSAGGPPRWSPPITYGSRPF